MEERNKEFTLKLIIHPLLTLFATYPIDSHQSSDATMAQTTATSSPFHDKLPTKLSAIRFLSRWTRLSSTTILRFSLCGSIRQLQQHGNERVQASRRPTTTATGLSRNRHWLWWCWKRRKRVVFHWCKNGGTCATQV